MGRLLRVPPTSRVGTGPPRAQGEPRQTAGRRRNPHHDRPAPTAAGALRPAEACAHCGAKLHAAGVLPISESLRIKRSARAERLPSAAGPELFPSQCY